MAICFWTGMIAIAPSTGCGWQRSFANRREIHGKNHGRNHGKSHHCGPRSSHCDRHFVRRLLDRRRHGVLARTIR